MAETTSADRGPVSPTPLVPLVDRGGPFAPLPVPLTDYVERPREAAALLDLLRPGGPRLVTLTGPGGAGKTRLALRVAAELAPRFPDGVAFIPLASVADADLVASTVATALGVQQSSAQPAKMRLAAALRTRELLLVLDNFEHLLPGALLITDLLTTCPTLTVLATSRTTLRLSGEHLFPVPPMALPPPDGSETTTIASQSEAVQLFTARARAALPGFTLSEQNVVDVTAVCCRLDGLPLAIELAAARITVLPPHALLARLDRRLPLLTGGPRDAPERLQTVHGAIAWSHDLLSPQGQILFRRLAVFAGGCTLNAAEAVAGDGVGVLDGISSLIAASLLHQQDGPYAVPRYGMLETIREYGLERLAASGEEATVRAAHAAWCYAIAVVAVPLSDSPQEDQWVHRFDAEHDNLRAALAWYAGSGDSASELRLVTALWWYWFLRGHYLEGRSQLARARKLSAGTRSRERAEILVGSHAIGLQLPGDAPHLEAWGEEALSIAREIGDTRCAIGAQIGLGFNAMSRADFEQATQFFEAALALAQVQTETTPGTAATILNNLAVVALAQVNDARADHQATEALTQQRANGSASGAADSLLILAVLAHNRSETQRAVDLCKEALHAIRPIRSLGTIVIVIDRLAMLAGEAGQAGHAAFLGGAVERLHEQLGTLPNPDE